MGDNLVGIGEPGDNGFSEAMFYQLTVELAEFEEDPVYQALFQYYRGVNQSAEVADKLAAATLLNNSINSLFQRRSSPPGDSAKQSLQALEQLTSRLNATMSMLSPAHEPVPKIMHFVRLGGSKVTDIQRDYMSIWRKVLAAEGYRFNLWYDSDALLAFKMNRVIRDSAKADAMESAATEETDPTRLAELIEHRARVLKRQMWDYLQQPQWAGRADEARIDLMVRVYGEDRATLEAFRQDCLDSHLALIGPDLQLRDAGLEFRDHPLRDIYQREVAMRGNFAAASHVVRLQALYKEGGRYSDMEYLPPLVDKPGGVDISEFSGEAKIGVLQLLLNYDDSLMPGRGHPDHADRTALIPTELQEPLLAFARGKPGLDKIFVAPRDQSAPHDGLRMGTAYGAASDGEMNEHVLAQPNSAMIESTQQVIRSNYDVLLEVERRLTEDASSWGDNDSLNKVVADVINEKEVEVWPTPARQMHLKKLREALLSYHQEGIHVDAHSAIFMTGSPASSKGIADYIEAHIEGEHALAVRSRMKLLEGYNYYTEAAFSTDGAINGEERRWLASEQERWTYGELTSRYLGNLSELLNEQTLEFDGGWPVVEGKPVLLTSVLQQLLHELHGQFVDVMNERVSGKRRFRYRFFIGPIERAQIRAQPDVKLPPSTDTQSLGYLNAAFSRMAAGDLLIEQLSPAHRVVLGGLFGATSLDEVGFARAWEAACLLAKNTEGRSSSERYMQIEQQLREQSGADFMLGLNTGMPLTSIEWSSWTSRVGMLFDPLSVRQWGENANGIESAARREYRLSILQRGAPVRRRMLGAGAVSVKQLPQGLLVSGTGDPWRRCYPLALVMAAVLEQGDAVELTWIGKLVNADLAQDDPQTHHLLRVLDDLRSVPMSQFGQKRTAMDSPRVMQILEEKADGASLMLNTDRHSLLISKHMVDDHAVYRFYDPNFGLYGFERAEDLQLGIGAFFADQKLALLYGIEDLSSATFDVLELDGSRICAEPLPSQLTVGELLGDHTVEPWQHHAALSTLALSHHPHLARAMTELDGRRWAQRIKQATRELLARHGLNQEYVPLYQTVEPAGEGKWTMTLVNRRRPGESLSVTLEDPIWFNARNWLHEQFMDMAKTLPVDVTPQESAAIPTLDAGLRIAALLLTLRQQGSAGEKEGESMVLGVRLQSYLTYIQQAHGHISTVVEVVTQIQQVLLDQRLITSTVTSATKHSFRLLVLGKAGFVLGLIGVGFDVYELVTAKDATGIAVAAVNLTFSLTTVALQGSALVAGGTFAAVAGPLAVVVGGVGFGVGALTRNYSSNLARAQAVAIYINKLRLALADGGGTTQQGVFHPIPEAVILQLDLRSRQVTLGSHCLFRGRSVTLGLPMVEEDIATAIDMRERWGLTERAEFVKGVHSAILPVTPKCYFNYDYQLLPGGANRHDLGFDDFRDLEYDSDGNRTFWFDPWIPFEYVVYKLFPVYKPTLIKVLLDEQCRSLYVPQIPKEWRGKVSYEIEASTGQYSLSLNEGVSRVDLRSQQAPEAVDWVIRVTWLSEKDVFFVAQGLDLSGGIQVRVAPDTKLILELDEGLFCQVDWVTQQLIPAAQQLPDNNKVDAVRKRLNLLTREHHPSSPYLSLHHLKVPFTHPDSSVYTHAYYEVAKERILYGRDFPQSLAKEVRLAAVMADGAYFYHLEAPTVWRVDTVSAQVTRRYRLLNTKNPSQILSCKDVGGALHVVQQFADPEGYQFQLEYLIRPDSVELTASSVSSNDPEFSGDEKDVEFVWKNFVSKYAADEVPNDGSPAMGGDIKTWTAAACVSYHIHNGTQTYAAWRRSRDDCWVHGKSLSIKNPILLAFQPDDSNTMLFYDVLEKAVWAWQRVPNSTHGKLSLLVKDVDSEQSVFASHLMPTVPGLVFDVRTSPARLRLLSEKWLRGQPDWLATLPAVLEQHQVSTLDIVGLSDKHGRPFAARYMEQQILLVDSVHGPDVQIVGLTPDEKAVWLFAPESAVLLRHPLLSLAQVRVLFGTGLKLSGHIEGISPQRVWRDWSFADVTIQGGGLRGRTREGVILSLVEGEPARIIGVDRAFIDARPSTGTLEERLHRLISNQSHAPILTAGRSPSRDQWYDTVRRRLFAVAGRMDDQWTTCLGVLSDGSYLLYDPVDQRLFSSNRKIWSQKVSAYRNEQVLTICCSEPVTDLQALLPEDIDKLILGFGDGGASCEVSPDDWARLDCIAVDLAESQSSQPPGPGKLVLLLPGLDNWWLSSGSGHLVLTDPDNAHTLIVRNALTMPATSRRALTLTLHLRGQHQAIGLEKLVLAWQAHGKEGQLHLLSEILDQSNED